MGRYYVDLFAGIGGFALGACWAGLKFDGHYYSEIEGAAIERYQRRFPEAVNLGDIREIDVNLLRLDMAAGGGLWQVGMAGKLKKLNIDQAVEAVKMYEAGMSLGKIGAHFSISRQAAWDLLRRRVKLRPQERRGEDNHFYRGGIQSDAHVHDLTEKAVECGLLVPQNCETCAAEYSMKDGRRAVQAHHDDYNKPLEVRWLCQKCHHKWHKANTAIRRNGEPAEVVMTGGFP